MWFSFTNKVTPNSTLRSYPKLNNLGSMPCARKIGINLLMQKLLIKCCWNWFQGLIPPKFYVQLLVVQIQKSTKRTDGSTVFCTLFGSGCVKAAHKRLLKLTRGVQIGDTFSDTIWPELRPGVNFINIICTCFSYERYFSSYMYIVKAAKTYIRTKFSYVWRWWYWLQVSISSTLSAQLFISKCFL